MIRRPLGRTHMKVSEIGFGAWAIGGDWGVVSEEDAMAALHAAAEAGVTFFDTADVYGDGRSERLLARLAGERPDATRKIATKVGRRLDPHVADGYTAGNLNAFVDRSLANLERDRLDLLQLHCPPTEVYYRPEVFDALDEMKADGKVRHYGVSVEKVEEGLKALEYPGVESVQIIFNILRQRPADLFFREAQLRGVGVIVRVPLASGLLTGKMTRDTSFAASDHRHFNRDGQSFDVGETFAGLPFDAGLRAAAEILVDVPDGASMAQLALRWILSFDGVSTVIPGAKTPEQVIENVAAADLEPLPDEAMRHLREVYEDYAKPYVHQRW